MKRILLSLALLSLTSLGFAQKKNNYEAIPTLVKEAKEQGNAKLADSLAQNYMDNYLFKLKEAQLMNKDNLLFISENMNSTDSRGFKLFFKQPNKINSVLGPNNAEYAIRKIISKQFIPEVDAQNPVVVDWDAIESTVVTKFGALGQEAVYGRRMRYYFIVKDWSNFAKYYVLYFEKALKRSEYHINNTSWPLFQHVNDPKVLKFACEVMKYAIEDSPFYKDHQALDTYANLLYKTGQKEKAIEWEEKAVKLSNNSKSIVETLDKMKRNERTWPDTAAKL